MNFLFCASPHLIVAGKTALNQISTCVVPPVCTIQVKVSPEVLLRKVFFQICFKFLSPQKSIQERIFGEIYDFDNVQLPIDVDLIFLPDESSCPPHSAFYSLQPSKEVV